MAPRPSGSSQTSSTSPGVWLTKVTTVSGPVWVLAFGTSAAGRSGSPAGESLPPGGTATACSPAVCTATTCRCCGNRSTGRPDRTPDRKPATGPRATPFQPDLFMAAASRWWSNAGCRPGFSVSKRTTRTVRGPCQRDTRIACRRRSSWPERGCGRPCFPSAGGVPRPAGNQPPPVPWEKARTATDAMQTPRTRRRTWERIEAPWFRAMVRVSPRGGSWYGSRP